MLICSLDLMFEGTCPFAAEAPLETYSNVESGVYEMPSDISEEAKNLLRRLLVKDPSKRLCPVKLVLFHPWITKYAPRDVLETLIGSTDK